MYMFKKSNGVTPDFLKMHIILAMTNFTALNLMIISQLVLKEHKIIIIGIDALELH